VSDIFQEIDEDLRRDKFSALWTKYQNLIYVAVAAIILGTAGVTAWRIYESRVQEQAGAEYLSALQATTQDPKAAVDVFAGLAEAGGPASGLARFDMARAALLAGDKQIALDMLTAMAGDAKVDAPMQGAAAIMGGHLALDLNQPNQAASLVAQLMSEGNAYRLMALEITGLAAHAAGDTAKAKQIFTDLEPLAAAPDAPAQLRERVAIMLDRLAQ
jgi:hypothetical protein